eukprot:CAMPEP_0114048232 /NCGR_PEP_ID=MMETSP1339-20121228/40923_1 /TAXON_ID=94617 /ORGANISM="Fibrocapsa japonica" /LENGTH=31 /assembly_acc=CAM_ASM_000762
MVSAKVYCAGPICNNQILCNAGKMTTQSNPT